MKKQVLTLLMASLISGTAFAAPVSYTHLGNVVQLSRKFYIVELLPYIIIGGTMLELKPMIHKFRMKDNYYCCLLYTSYIIFTPFISLKLYMILVVMTTKL